MALIIPLPLRSEVGRREKVLLSNRLASLKKLTIRTETILTESIPPKQKGGPKQSLSHYGLKAANYRC